MYDDEILLIEVRASRTSEGKHWSIDRIVTYASGEVTVQHMGHCDDPTKAGFVFAERLTDLLVME